MVKRKVKGKPMKKLGWSLLLVTSQSVSKVRQFRIPLVSAILIGIVSTAGLVGLTRLILFTTSYGFAKFGAYEARSENDGLLLKIKFLSKFIDKESEKLQTLICFEDNVRLQYGMNQISKDVRLAGVGGKPLSEDMLMATLLDPMLVKAEAVKESLTVLLRKAELQDSTLSQMTRHVERIHQRWAQRPSIWPTAGRLTSPYGYRVHPILGISIFHEGLDIANKTMTPVYATADGVVKTAGSEGYFGRMILLDHKGSGYETLYGHLQKMIVTEGQKVSRGELIGYMGNSGRSTGPHLHYQVMNEGHLVNPLSCILPIDIVVD